MSSNSSTTLTLLKEPENLRQEAARLQQTLEALYRSNYATIIENHECMAFIQERGQGFHADLAALQTEVERLKGDCKAFAAGAQEIVGGLKRNRQTLQHHLQLVELLEVPQLMDACLRNGLFDEAVEIVAFANTLERRHLLVASSVTAAAAAAGRERESQLSRSSSSLGKEQQQQQAKHTVVIASLVQDLRALQKQLREMLLHHLRLPIQLPRCLQVISCLRKLDGLALEVRLLGHKKKQLSMSTSSAAAAAAAAAAAKRGLGVVGGNGEAEHEELERQLQAEFLEARDAWLQSLLERNSSSSSSSSGGGGGGGSDGGAGQLMAVIETNRTHWFEIATQFRAIFLDDDLASSSSSSSSSLPASSSSSLLCSGGEGGGGSKALSAWLLRRITAFLSQLEGGLAQVNDGAALVDVMEQCLFFAASMGRIGGDFRELLVPVFGRATRGMANGQWVTAKAELAGLLERCMREGGVVMKQQQQQQHQMLGSGMHSSYQMCYVVPGTVSSSSSSSSSSKQEQAATPEGSSTATTTSAAPPLDPLAPPPSILSYPTLAQFTNLVLSSFNQLRQCTPWAMVNELQSLFLLHMRGAAEVLVAHQQQLQQQQQQQQRQQGGLLVQYKQMREEAEKVVFPYLLRCFAAMVVGGEEKEEGGKEGGKAGGKKGVARKEKEAELLKMWTASSSEVLLAAE